MNRYTVIPMFPEHIEEICQDIKQQYESGIADLALLIFNLYPDGDPLIPKAEQQAEQYVKFRDRLAEMGLKCGIVVQSTMGHGLAGVKKPPIQSYVNLNDGEEKNIPCPLDETFREYIRKSLTVVASTNPEAIMIDDDFRLVHRTGLGCACPAHMKQMEKLISAPLTRQSLLEAVLGDSREGKRISEIFVKNQIQTLIDTAKIMREGIDAVDRRIQGIFCTCGISAEGAGEIASILAGEGNPSIVRVNNGNYAVSDTRKISVAFQRAAIEKAVINSQKKVDIFLAETDTFPRLPYSTSAQLLHAQYVGTILEGVFGAKHWLSMINAYEPEVGKVYRKKLMLNAKLYDKLTEIVPTLKWKGCRSPISTIPDYCFNGFWNSDALNNWVPFVLERMGLPVYFSAENGGAVFLEGNSTELFSDKEIIEMLSGTLFLDGYAVKNLQSRGFSEYIGAEVREWDGAPMQFELVGEEEQPVYLQIGGLELKPFSDVRVESVVCNKPDGITKNVLFPGSVSYKNSIGGKVVTFSGTPKVTTINHSTFSMLCRARKEQFIRLLKETGNLPVYYPGDAEVYLKAAQIPDGETFVAFINIGLDILESVTLVPEKTVTRIEKLDSNGERVPVNFKMVNGILELDIPAYTLEPIILFLL